MSGSARGGPRLPLTGLDKAVAEVKELLDPSKIGGAEVCVLAAAEMGAEIVIHDIDRTATWATWLPGLAMGLPRVT